MYSTNVFASGGKTKFTKRQIAGIVVVCVILIGFVIGKIFFRPSPAEVQEQTAEVIKQGDITKCDSFDGKVIEGVYYGTVCRNNVALNRALEQNDIASCKELDNVLMHSDDCEQQVIMKLIAESDNISVCENASSPEMKQFCQDNFWFATALKSLDVRICANLTEKTKEQSCVKNYYVTLLARDPKSVSCNQVPETLKNDCLVLQKQPSSEQCKLLHHPMLRRECSRNVSIENIPIPLQTPH